MKTKATFRGTTVTLLAWGERTAKLQLEDPRRTKPGDQVWAYVRWDRTDPSKPVFSHPPKFGPRKLMLAMAKEAMLSGTSQEHHYTFCWARPPATVQPAADPR